MQTLLYNEHLNVLEEEPSLPEAQLDIASIAVHTW